MKIFPLLVILMIVSGYAMTKKECCNKCKQIEINCGKYLVDLYIKGASHSMQDAEEAKCNARIRDCKADCGGGCALLEK